MTSITMHLLRISSAEDYDSAHALAAFYAEHDVQIFGDICDELYYGLDDIARLANTHCVAGFIPKSRYIHTNGALLVNYDDILKFLICSTSRESVPVFTWMMRNESMRLVCARKKELTDHMESDFHIMA